MSNLRIAIIGAGPAGLTLARLLQINKMTCTVFELDKGPGDRDQGGTVDLHEKGGQLALREAGLLEQFKRLSRPEGEALKLMKFDGTVVYDENKTGTRRPGEYSGRPEIDRLKLRYLLLDSLSPDTVVWGRKLVSVEPSSSGAGKYDLHFQDGVEKGFGLIVGADGAWSKVRKVLTDQQPFYSGITGIELWALDVDKRRPWLSDFVGAGSCFMFDEGRAIQAQKTGENGIRMYASIRQPQEWLEQCGIDWSSPREAKEQYLERYFADCAPELKRAVLEADDQLIPRQMWMLPIGMKWNSRAGATLIGDAAHLMTPFAGVGVNLAMVDSLTLAKAVVECGNSGAHLAEAIKTYEEEMFVRAEQFARKTGKGLVNHFSAGGAEELAARVAGA